MYMDLGTAAGVSTRQFFDNKNRNIDFVQDIDVGKVRKILIDEYEQRVEGPFW